MNMAQCAFCPSCGIKVEGERNFCTQCGASVLTDGNNPPPQQQYGYANPVSTSKNKMNVICLIASFISIICAFLPFFGAEGDNVSVFDGIKDGKIEMLIIFSIFLVLALVFALVPVHAAVRVTFGSLPLALALLFVIDKSFFFLTFEGLGDSFTRSAFKYFEPSVSMQIGSILLILSLVLYIVFSLVKIPKAQ